MSHVFECVPTVPVKLSCCVVKVPMFAMMNLLLVVQGRAHRGLVGDPMGEGRVGCIAQRPQQRGGQGGTRNLFREEGTECQGNLLGWTVAAMKPKAQPLPRQDSRQAKAAVGCDLRRKATWLWHLRTELFWHASFRSQGQSESPRMNAPCALTQI